MKTNYNLCDTFSHLISLLAVHRLAAAAADDNTRRSPETNPLQIGVRSHCTVCDVVSCDRTVATMQWKKNLQKICDSNEK